VNRSDTMTGLLIRFSAAGREALADIFGLAPLRYRLHEIISDETGELQRRALRVFKLVRYLERRRARREALERRLWLKDQIAIYRDN